MKPPDERLEPKLLATVTSCGPLAPAGTFAVSSVFEATFTPVAREPPTSSVTDGPAPDLAQFRPVAVIEVPPAFGPKSGVMPKTTGALVGCGSLSSRKPSPAPKLAESSGPAVGSQSETYTA